MNAELLYWLTGIVTAGLFVYLLYALLKAEDVA
ncbi:K(+)-transporting ATPase subunit F [Chitinimonas sp.]